MVTGSYVDATDPNTVIVVMDMETLDAAQQFAASPELGVWLGPRRIDGI